MGTMARQPRAPLLPAVHVALLLLCAACARVHVHAAVFDLQALGAVADASDEATMRKCGCNTCKLQCSLAIRTSFLSSARTHEFGRTGLVCAEEAVWEVGTRIRLLVPASSGSAGPLALTVPRPTPAFARLAATAEC